MNIIENPIEYCTEKKFGDIELLYSRLMEICQGGPMVGDLSINGKVVKGRYGGPTIYKDGYLYIPIYVKKFWGFGGTGFKLAKINEITLDVELLGNTKNLIFLNKLENHRIYFFEDINKTVQRYYEL